MKRTVEFWAIDKDGNKYNEYIKTKLANKKKIKLLIEQKYKFKISECIDFGFRIHIDY